MEKKRRKFLKCFLTFACFTRKEIFTVQITFPSRNTKIIKLNFFLFREKKNEGMDIFFLQINPIDKKNAIKFSAYHFFEDVQDWKYFTTADKWIKINVLLIYTCFFLISRDLFYTFAIICHTIKRKTRRLEIHVSILNWYDFESDQTRLLKIQLTFHILVIKTGLTTTADVFDYLSLNL